MSYEIQGEIIAIGAAQTFASGFTKREVVITTGGNYPQSVPFDCIKGNVDKLDGVNVGDVINIDFDVRGREWEGRYFCNLQAWRFEVVQGTEIPGQPSDDGIDPSDGLDMGGAPVEGDQGSMLF
jgi:hypothetical protein